MFYSKKSLSRELIRWLMVITIFSLGCTQARAFKPTVKFLNFGMPEIFAVIYLKYKQRGQTSRVFCQNGTME